MKQFLSALEEKKAPPTRLRAYHKISIEEFENIMTMEYRIANRCFKGHDLFEGIRSVVVDKDRAPKWLPSKVDDISEEDIDEYFAPISDEPNFYNY